MLQIIIMKSIDSEQRWNRSGLTLSRFLSILIGFCGIMQADIGLAGDIDFKISLSEIYTSNLFLQPEELAVSDYVTRISPGLDFTRKGNGLEATISYAYEALFYAAR